MFFTSHAQPTPDFDPHAFFAQSEKIAEWPGVTLAQARNGVLDWAFYDVRVLSPEEFSMLSRERTQEGAILVVKPDQEGDESGIQKFANHAELRAAPGDLVSHFCIAGVGSSDIGAAAFARTIANHYQKPVGAIVAGYGMADLVSEAMGGWFILGSANRFMQIYHRAMADVETLSDLGHLWQQPGLSAFQDMFLMSKAEEAPEVPNKEWMDATALEHGSDIQTLLALLNDEDRTIHSLCGHSKGCLSIAYGLEQLVLSKKLKTIRKAGDIRIITAGAVVALPKGFNNVSQYLGSIDWFGGLNSRSGIEHTKVEQAWHHLNTQIPNHLNFADILAEEG